MGPHDDLIAELDRVADMFGARKTMIWVLEWGAARLGAELGERGAAWILESPQHDLAAWDCSEPFDGPTYGDRSCPVCGDAAAPRASRLFPGAPVKRGADR
jgi:hypothetical protein